MSPGKLESIDSHGTSTSRSTDNAGPLSFAHREMWLTRKAYVAAGQVGTNKEVELAQQACQSLLAPLCPI